MWIFSTSVNLYNKVSSITQETFQMYLAKSDKINDSNQQSFWELVDILTEKETYNWTEFIQTDFALWKTIFPSESTVNLIYNDMNNNSTNTKKWLIQLLQSEMSSEDIQKNCQRIQNKKDH